MELEDHIPQEHEASLAERINDMLMLGDFDAAGLLLTDTLIDFFDFYRSEPILYKMLNIANSVIVVESGSAARFNIQRRTMTLPRKIAALVESGHDLACLLLIERSRLIVNKQAHTFLPQGMNLKVPEHKVAFNLARACWSNAVARCYCASILPERLYGMRNDFMSMLMHGAIPDQFVDILHECKMPNVGCTYMALYQMSGQEQYHAAMNRMPMCSGTISFEFVLNNFWKDLEALANEYANERERASEKASAMVKQMLENGQLSDGDLDALEKAAEEAIDEMLSYESVVNDDGSDDSTEQIQGQMEDAGSGGYARHRFGKMTPRPIPDIDADSELDAYLAEIINMDYSLQHRRNFYFDDPRLQVPNVQSVRSVFQPLQHTVMLHLSDDEDAARYGSMCVPERPSARDLAMHLQGHTPMLWETRASPRQSGANASYASYTDVSGSQFQWLPFVRAMARTLGIFVDPDHRYVFSDSIAKYDENAAFVLTTGGTDIEEAVKDAQAKHLPNIILITDMEDSTDPIDTTGIDHIIIVLTDADEAIDLSETMFSQATATTKFDIYPITLKQLTVHSDDLCSKHPHFSNMPDTCI